MLVSFVARCVSSFTLVDALGCISSFPRAGGSAAIHMVFTGGDGVRPTTCTHKEYDAWIRITDAHIHTHTHKQSLTHTHKTHQCGSHRDRQRPAPHGSRSPRQLKGSHRCIWVEKVLFLNTYKNTKCSHRTIQGRSTNFSLTNGDSESYLSQLYWICWYQLSFYSK